MGSGSEALSARIRRVAANINDMTTLGQDVQKVIIAGNELDRRAGRNRFGHKMPTIKPGTAKARGRKGRGQGPYLAPGPGSDPRESRVISNFFCRLKSHLGAAGFRIEWGWRAIPWLRFFNARAATDISGTGPATGKRIAETIRAFLGGVWEK